MASVILTQTDVVECVIVILHILLSAFRLGKQPFLKLFLDHVLLFPCKHKSTAKSIVDEAKAKGRAALYRCV